VEVSQEHCEAFEAKLEGCHFVRLGRTTPEAALKISLGGRLLLELEAAELYQVWSGYIPAFMGL